MKLQPMLHERSAGVATTATVVVPTVYGAICGAVLGQSKTGYSVLLLLSLIGGFLAGLDHDDLLEGAWRGLLGGLLFGTAQLVVYQEIGDIGSTKLPDPLSLIVVYAAIVGALLATGGAALRRRTMRRAARTREP